MTVSDYFLANHQSDVRWHPERNAALSPTAVSCGSHKRAWFRCSRGHEWEALIVSVLLNGCGCPYCTGRKVLPGFNDLATLNPKVAEQWHPTLNQPLTPAQITLGSNKKVWWQCQEGHVWNAAIYSRTRAKPAGCPVCTGTVRRRTKPSP